MWKLNNYRREEPSPRLVIFFSIVGGAGGAGVKCPLVESEKNGSWRENACFYTFRKKCSSLLPVVEEIWCMNRVYGAGESGRKNAFPCKILGILINVKTWENNENCEISRYANMGNDLLARRNSYLNIEIRIWDHRILVIFIVFTCFFANQDPQNFAWECFFTTRRFGAI